jgi:hypothetical protein
VAADGFSRQRLVLEAGMGMRGGTGRGVELDIGSCIRDPGSGPPIPLVSTWTRPYSNPVSCRAAGASERNTSHAAFIDMIAIKSVGSALKIRGSALRR